MYAPGEPFRGREGSATECGSWTEVRHEADGILSAINFRLTIEKVEDPDGGHRAVITRNSKYLPTEPW
jgi:cyanate lyase